MGPGNPAPIGEGHSQSEKDIVALSVVYTTTIK